MKRKQRLLSWLLAAVLAGTLAVPVCQVPAQAASVSDSFYQKLGRLLDQQEESGYFNSMELAIGSRALTVDGQTQQMDVTPTIKNNRTMLPIRAIAEAAGAEVDFESASRTVVIVGASGDTIRCQTGASAMTVNGERHPLDTPSYIQGGRTYLPVRAVSEALELDVQWEAATREVTITAPYQTARVLAWTEKLNASALGADAALYDGNGLWVLQFIKPSEAKAAVEMLSAQGIPAEADTYLPPVDDKAASGGQTNLSWGVSACGFDRFLQQNKLSAAQSGVVAVVDTGVDGTHPLLKGKVLPGRDFVDGDSDPKDEHYHGTHVAGTVVDCVGSAPVKILPVRVLNEEGFGYDVTIVSGIRYAADQKADVINLSLRRDRWTNGTDNIDRAVQYAIEKGSLVVAAAGNDEENTSGYCPAHMTSAGVVVVSAGDSKGQKASFSNYGSSVDLMAPGVGIRSAVPGNSYRVLDGTSMAAPHVSAAAVLLDLAGGKSFTPAQLESKVRAATTNQGVWKDVYAGCGFLSLSDAGPTPVPIPEPEPEPEPVPVPVPEAKVASYRYNVSTLKLEKGESANIKVTAVYTDGTTRDVTRESGLYSSNSGVATVDSSGTVKALKKGQATITMGATPAAGVSIPKPVTVTVEDPVPEVKVASYRYNVSSLNLKEGESASVKVTAVYTDGSTKDVTRDSGLYSSSPSVASVDSSGTVKALKKGSAVLSMGSTPAAGVSIPKPISVTVTAPPENIVVDRVVLTSSFVQVVPGESSQVQAVVYSNSPTPLPASWQSSDSSIATVTDGKITGVRPGDCVVTASAGGKSASCRVRVNEYRKSDFQVSILSGPGELTKGETGSFVLNIKTPIPYEERSHPLILYCALYVRGAEGALNGWLEYQSKYYDGGTQTVIYNLDTSMHDIPSGTYMMVFSLFYADRFYTGASIVDTITTLKLN